MKIYLSAHNAEPPTNVNRVSAKLIFDLADGEIASGPWLLWVPRGTPGELVVLYEDDCGNRSWEATTIVADPVVENPRHIGDLTWALLLNGQMVGRPEGLQPSDDAPWRKNYIDGDLASREIEK